MTEVVMKYIQRIDLLYGKFTNCTILINKGLSMQGDIYSHRHVNRCCEILQYFAKILGKLLI